MKIWRIQTQDDLFGYPFSISNEEEQRHLDVFDKFHKGIPLAQNWKPAMICHLHEVDIGLLIEGDEEFLVLTERAKKLLEPLLKKSVEYFPCISKEEIHKKISHFQQITQKKVYQPIIDTVHCEQQYIINTLDIKTIEVIDFEQSECRCDEETGEIWLVDSLAFKPELIKGSHLFKIDNPGIDFQSAIFVSDEFRMIVEKNNLRGLMFLELPEDEGGNLIWQSPQEISQPVPLESSDILSEYTWL